MGAEGLILLDSNVWIYLLDRDTPENPMVDRRLADPLRSEEVMVPTLVQAEVLHYIVRQLRSGAEGVVTSFLSFPGTIQELSSSVVHAGARILLDHHGQGIGGRDAMILAMARLAGAELVTNDDPLSRVAKRTGVAVWQPLRSTRRRAKNG